jgi:hypothetical protein
VGVNGDPIGALAAAMEPLGVGEADLDPGGHAPGQVAHPDRGLIAGGNALAERDAGGVLEAVGQDAGNQKCGRLGRVAGDAQIELLVHAAIHVGEFDGEGVNGRALGHGAPLRRTARARAAAALHCSRCEPAVDAPRARIACLALAWLLGSTICAAMTASSSSRSRSLTSVDAAKTGVSPRTNRAKVITIVEKMIFMSVFMGIQQPGVNNQHGQ